MADGLKVLGPSPRVSTKFVNNLSTQSRFHLCPTLCDPMECSPLAPLSMGFHWSGLPFPSPGYLPDPGIEPMSLTSPALAGGFFTTSAPWEAQIL